MSRPEVYEIKGKRVTKKKFIEWMMKDRKILATQPMPTDREGVLASRWLATNGHEIREFVEYQDARKFAELLTK